MYQQDQGLLKPCGKYHHRRGQRRDADLPYPRNRTTSLSTLEQDILGQTSKIEDISGKVDEISGAKMYRIELLVEGASIFRDKGQQSILRCKVYSWDKDITDTLEPAVFFWHRKSGNAEADADWDGLHQGNENRYRINRGRTGQCVLLL